MISQVDIDAWNEWERAQPPDPAASRCQHIYEHSPTLEMLYAVGEVSWDDACKIIDEINGDAWHPR